VFLPNLFLSSSKRQSHCFAGLQLLDERVLFDRSQIEKRGDSYKNLAAALTFNYFGAHTFAEASKDNWLLQGVRASVGNHFRIKRTGIYMYRYGVMK